MHAGKIRSFNDISGTGFIESDEFPGILRFSYKEIKKTGYKIVNEGERVLFEVYSSSKGLLAVNVTLVQ